MNKSPSYFFRRHCLSRWTFCDILQIEEGPGRWRKYFFQRRKVDASLDTGRPVRDFKVVCVCVCVVYIIKSSQMLHFVAVCFFLTGENVTRS